MKKLWTLIWLAGMLTSCHAQKDLPKSFSHLKIKNNQTGIEYNGKFYPVKPVKQTPLTYENIAEPEVSAWEKGVELDFGDPAIEGTLYYGLIDETSRYKLPVLSKRTAKIKKGKAQINLTKLTGKYDFTGWEKTGKIRLGYRIIDKKGRIIADNRLNVLYENGKFLPSVSMIEGPFLSMPSPDGIKIQATFDRETEAELLIDGKPFTKQKGKYMVFDVNGLKPSTTYQYTLVYGPWKETYSFQTAPEKGSRKPFVFAYASDSRNAKGGGERNIYGTNAYILKRMMVLADQSNAGFFMFTGDMINGYHTNARQQRLEYFNFKNAVRYLTAYRPMYLGMGNHEALSMAFDKWDEKSPEPWIRYINIDRYPFETESAEKLFADVFVLPQNGPESEDGASYDPSRKTKDFPSYKENVYSFTYGNVAFIVLNSNYWYTTNENYIPIVSGNPHGYVMDNQLAYLKEQLARFDADPSIDHVFVTIHTPLFPNAGHANNDMWYFGNNDIRARVAGKPLEKGIIERRDELMKAMTDSHKFRALLAGDEHNYTRLVVDNDTPVYPANWQGERIKLRRPFLQITNGAAGAPYYALEKLPWTEHVKKFSTQNALMFFEVNGKKIHVMVVNPDTLEKIEDFNIQTE